MLPAWLPALLGCQAGKLHRTWALILSLRPLLLPHATPLHGAPTAPPCVHVCVHVQVYELYTDFVLKNPFYELEMPIRCDLFDLAIESFVSKMFSGA